MEETHVKTIAIDMDDVIAANAAGFVAWSNAQFGTNLTIDDYQEHWADMWNVDREEVTRRAEKHIAANIAATHAPIEGAFDALQKLAQRFRLIIITSRRVSGKETARAWLETHYPKLFDDIIFTGFYDVITEHSFSRTKGDIAKEHKADYVIDDQLKHVLAAAEHSIPALLFGEYGWNKSGDLPSLVTRVRNWEEVLDYFANI